jgi:hypothetical protein
MSMPIWKLYYLKYYRKRARIIEIISVENSERKIC